MPLKRVECWYAQLRLITKKLIKNRLIICYKMMKNAMEKLNQKI